MDSLFLPRAPARGSLLPYIRINTNMLFLIWSFPFPFKTFKITAKLSSQTLLSVPTLKKQRKNKSNCADSVTSNRFISINSWSRCFSFPDWCFCCILNFYSIWIPVFTGLGKRKWKRWQQRLGEGPQTGLPVDDEALFWIQSLPASLYLAFTTVQQPTYTFS